MKIYQYLLNVNQILLRIGVSHKPTTM